ncbi:MAG TPA: signal peptide peptidase SppA [Nitrospiraceae bacterium]|nr:signal peptide peptidase SppA [Nitrospiraceae bacterium]
MRKTRLMCSLVMIAATVFVSGCVTINLVPGPGAIEEKQLSGTGRDKILLLEVSGLISSHESDGFIEHPSILAQMKEALTRAADDTRVKAVVLRINSPGGTVTASDILYHELLAFKEKRKIPVIASIMDVGASGGYYIAMAADKLVVHPSSITGSLGVIMMTVNARGLLEKIGVDAVTVKSGPRKDMGSPFRSLTEEEQAIFQGVIMSFYDRFLAVIKEGRKNLTAADIKKLADGRIYSGEQATTLGLADSVGYLDDAIELAKHESGVSEATVVTYRRPGEYKNNIYSQFLGSGAATTWNPLANLDLMALFRGGTPQFMYLWTP